MSHMDLTKVLSGQFKNKISQDTVSAVAASMTCESQAKLLASLWSLVFETHSATNRLELSRNIFLPVFIASV